MSGSGMMVAVPRAAGLPVTWGLLALRSASGLGLLAAKAGRPAPTAFNRAGEKLQATRGRAAQGVVRGWSPTPGRARSPPFVREEGLRAPMLDRGGVWPWVRQPPPGGGRAGRRGLAGGDGGVPAGAVDDHAVDPAQQRGSAGDPCLGAARPGCGGRRASGPGAGGGVRCGVAGSLGHRLVLGCHHGVELEHRPYHAPGRQPQARPSPAGDVRIAEEGTGGVVRGGQPGVLDQRG
jgi:hypothetical protein